MADTLPATFKLSADALIVRDLPAGLPEGRIQETIEAALRKVAERLSRSPLGWSGFRRLALERLELGTIPADELLSERGAERLADELYAALGAAMPSFQSDRGSPASIPSRRTE
jgi:hypothetical protein